MMETSEDQITLVIADDHPLVRQGIRAYLETQADMELVGEASSGQEALSLCSELAPDVLIMDLLMPGMKCVDACRQIKNVSPRTQILILTSYDNKEFILPVIQAGAISYLLKDVTPTALADAIRRAFRGETTIHPQVAAQLVNSLQHGQAENINPFAGLSEREIEVLKLVADGCSNADIANKLIISEKTVKSHVSNVLSKLHLADRTKAAVYAWREGLMGVDNNTNK